MIDDTDKDLIAEIEAFRAELHIRSAQHARSLRAASPLDLPLADAAQLDLAQIRAMISQRYEHARYERRLQNVERRLAELEARND